MPRAPDPSGRKASGKPSAAPAGEPPQHAASRTGGCVTGDEPGRSVDLEALKGSRRPNSLAPASEGREEARGQGTRSCLPNGACASSTPAGKVIHFKAYFKQSGPEFSAPSTRSGAKDNAHFPLDI